MKQFKVEGLLVQLLMVCLWRDTFGHVQHSKDGLQLATGVSVFITGDGMAKSFASLELTERVEVSSSDLCCSPLCRAQNAAASVCLLVHCWVFLVRYCQNLRNLSSSVRMRRPLTATWGAAGRG